MRESRRARWWTSWRRRSLTAWGSLLDEQEILLAALSVQQAGGVRVLLFEHLRAPPGLSDAAARDNWLVQTLRGPGAHLPARLRTMALALREGRCRQGVLELPADLREAAWVAEVQLEAAAALGVAPSEVGFDFQVRPAASQGLRQLHWAACLRIELEHWQRHARSAGWRLPVVEPEHQAARRAAMALRGDPMQHWAVSPQDWQFSLTPERALSESDSRVLQSSPMWGPLVACGAALGALL